MINKKNKWVISLVLILMLFAPIVSAGPGIKWSQESSLVPERTNTCLTYDVYNPWNKDSYVQIRLSDELEEITKSAKSEIKFVPANTASTESIPVEFCFKTPNIYLKDCLVGSFICKKLCEEPMKVYEGQVEVIELSEEEAKIGGGAGGSATQMSVSAPLRVRVQCIPHDRNYSIVYGLIALIAGILLWINIVRKKKSKKELRSKK